jgi:hypothetical protein
MYETSDSTVPERVPEFRLSGAQVTRYEKNAKTAELSAKTVEQYRRNNAIFASGVSFVMYEADGGELGRGKCGLILADNTNDNYVLFDSIVFENTRDRFEVHADALKWASKRGILASSKNGTVEIVKTRAGSDEAGDSRFSLSGAQFSADKNRRTFAFDGPIQGEFITGDEDEQIAQEN